MVAIDPRAPSPLRRVRARERDTKALLDGREQRQLKVRASCFGLVSLRVRERAERA